MDADLGEQYGPQKRVFQRTSSLSMYIDIYDYQYMCRHYFDLYENVLPAVFITMKV